MRISEWRKVHKDERIISEGEAGQEFFMIAGGAVKVLKGGRLLSVLHKGDCFGEMAHLSGQEFVRTTDVVAKDETILIEVKPALLAQASTGCRYQFSEAFLHMLVKRLAVANTRISHLLNDRGDES